MAGIGKLNPQSGRQKGTPNKKTAELMDLIEEACPGFNPVVAMAKIAHFGVIRRAVMTPDPMNAERFIQATDADGQPLYTDQPIADEHRVKCLTEVSQYVAPKRKAVEHSGGIQTSGGVLLVDKVADPEAWLAATNPAAQAAAASTE